MAVKTSQYPTGYISLTCFERKTADVFVYHSPIQHRDYDLHYIKIDAAYQWVCNCPDARYISHKVSKQCKHEKALSLLQWRHEKGKAEAELSIEEEAEQSEIAALRAEVAHLRAELAETRAAQVHTSQAEDISAIQHTLTTLQAENAEMKRILATKATARKKHQTETEAAQIKEQINTILDDAKAQAESTIQALAMARAGLADLEALPHSIKQELDTWTEAGKEELQPDYQAPDPNDLEIRALVRTTQESARQRREATTEERRKMAPINGNQGFNFYR